MLSIAVDRDHAALNAGMRIETLGSVMACCFASVHAVNLFRYTSWLPHRREPARHGSQSAPAHAGIETVQHQTVLNAPAACSARQVLRSCEHAWPVATLSPPRFIESFL